MNINIQVQHMCCFVHLQHVVKLLVFMELKWIIGYEL
jgi:hypothetical protein